MLLVACASYRDRRELRRLGHGESCIFHASEWTKWTHSPAAAVDASIDRLVEDARARGVTAVLSTDDHLGTLLASIVAHRLGLPGPAPAACAMAQHKYYGRLVALAAVPGATPPFDLAVEGRRPSLLDTGPAYVKPCKSFSAFGARQVASAEEWAAVVHDADVPDELFAVFDHLAQRTAHASISARELLVEGLLPGRTCVLEGVRQAGRMHVLGIVDVTREGNYERFTYPSSIPPAVDERMRTIANRMILTLGYDDGGFNVTMTWDEASDMVGLLHVNPRSTPQLGELFERVDGRNTYELLVDVARGRPIDREQRQGSAPSAAIDVLRRVPRTRSGVELRAQRVPIPEAAGSERS